MHRGGAHDEPRREDHGTLRELHLSASCDNAPERRAALGYARLRQEESALFVYRL